MEQEAYSAHVLVVPYPSQGHINPMLQFCKTLHSKGLKTTLAITKFISKSFKPQSNNLQTNIDTISDGYDDGGFNQAESIEAYISAFEIASSQSIAELIGKYSKSMHPVTCVMYDAACTWCLTVAKKYGLAGAAFFTQSCATNNIYYYLYHGLLKLPLTSVPVKIPGLPLLDIEDMPGFICNPGKYAGYFQALLNQHSNVDKADFVLVNSYYELEQEVVDSMSKLLPMLTIGPTIPSTHLDNQTNQQDDKVYGLDLFDDQDSTPRINQWFSTKPSKSVIYVSFGTMGGIDEDQMLELLWGLIRSNHYFLWVVRASEQAKLPKDNMAETRNKGLIVEWSSQLQVLTNDAVGCFVTHCGWNSCIEGLSLGVPMVAVPQWTDQTTNAKFITDVWKVGVRVKVDGESRLVRREEIETCIRDVMDEGKRGKEMRRNAKIYSSLAKQAVLRGGSSDNNINEFVSKLVAFKGF